MSDVWPVMILLGLLVLSLFGLGASLHHRDQQTASCVQQGLVAVEYENQIYCAPITSLRPSL